MKLLSIPLVLLLGTGCGLFGGKDDDSTFVPPTEPPFDCDDLRNPDDWDFIELENTAEEFAFDKEGFVVMAADWSGAILRQDRNGAVEVVAPFQSDELAGVDLFPNGDILFADEENGALYKMTTSGVESLLAGGLTSPNSVVVHPGGTVFATDFDEILEIRPGQGDIDIVVPHGDYDLDGLALSMDYEHLWFNEDELGDVYRVRVDGSEPPELMAELSTGQGIQLDGMAIDACDNVYALRTDGRVYRIRPDGSVETFVTVERPGDMWTSALHFGSGVGGWDSRYLYIMDRYGGLFEVFVGVPGVPEPHL